MQGAEIKDEGSVRKYMTKSEIDEQRSSLHIMTQRLSLLVFHDYRALHCMLQDTLPFQKNIVVISSVS